MKNKLVSILLIGALMITTVGCGTTEVSSQQNATKKTVEVEVKKQDEASPKTEEPKIEEVEKPIKTDNNTIVAEPSNKQIVTEPRPKAKPQVKSDIKPVTTTPKANSEYIAHAPLTSIDTINISPKHVYFKDSKLYMDAYIYNGFSHNVFNIRDINIRLSNKSGVVAEAIFGGLENQTIAPKNYIVWTFVFNGSAIKMPNADLEYLKTNFKCNNSF